MVLKDKSVVVDLLDVRLRAGLFENLEPLLLKLCSAC